MILEHIRVRNYKSIVDTTLDLEPGLNVLVGANNAGKTALLECIRLQFHDLPHRSALTIPRKSRGGPAGHSTVDARLRFTAADVRDYLESRKDIQMPPASEGGPDAHGIMDAFERWLATAADLRFMATFTGHSGTVQVADPAFGLYPSPSTDGLKGTAGIARDEHGHWQQHSGGGRSEELLVLDIIRLHRQGLHFYTHDRRSQAFWSDSVKDATLSVNAHNLVAVLERLQANPRRLEHFKTLVRQVLPDVEEIAVSRTQASEIRLWFKGVPAERDDLSVSLSQCGAGVEQVLSLVCAAMHALDGPLVVDEPQAYLHPGAFKRLVGLLVSSRPSQIIIATHTPSLLMRHASSVHLVQLQNGATHATRLRLDSQDSIRAALNEVGASPEDLFGAEAVLWVEGPTEAQSFPHVMGAFSREFPSLRVNALVAAVPSADRFEAARREKTLDQLLLLYERVSGSHALLPPALGFVLDREARDAARRADLSRRVRGRLGFTRRRMYENYLLVPDAVDSVLRWEAEQRGVAGFTVNRPLIESILAETLETTGHGADSLKHVFEGHELSFDKIVHGRLLTAWILEHEPLRLRPVAELLDQCIRGVNVET